MSEISFSDRAVGDFLQLRRLRRRNELFASAAESRSDSLRRHPAGTVQPADTAGLTVQAGVTVQESRDPSILIAGPDAPEGAG